MVRLRPFGWLLCLTLASCTLIPTPPSLPTPVRPPDLRSTGEALQAAVAGDYPLDALAIHYQIGSEAWEGRTALTVRGTGAVEVSFDQAGQHQSWPGSVGSGEFLALCQLLVEHEVWAIRGQRETGVPDEAYPTVTIEAEGFEALSVGMWHGEALEHPGFGPIVDALARLALDVSGGVAR